MTKKELEDKIRFLEEKLENSENVSGKVNHEIHIIYPNVAHLAQWEELRYSLRSLQKNLRMVDFKVFIVGDFPSWGSDKLTHIQCDFTKKTPRIDILHKHLAVGECKEVNEEYIWMNDDIYFVNPVSYADLSIIVSRNKLATALKLMPQQTVWGRDNAATLKLLMNEKLPSWNYGIHVPHRYEKERVKFLVDKYKMLETPIVLEQLYYNYWFRDFTPYIASLDIANNIVFSINRENPNTRALNTQLRVKKFMNNGEAGMGAVLQQTLKKLFPEPSVFER